MNQNVILADSVKYQPQWYAMDIWMQQTFKRIDLSKLLIYFVSVVDSDVLPFLAQEFDVLGTKGWDYATTDDEQRDLIRKAVQLHRYKGTPWAIKQVMAQAGLIGATLLEGTGTGPGGWAVFRIVLDITVLAPDPAQIANAVTLINLYKPQRCILEGLFYTNLDFTETDGLSMDEEDLIVDADETISGDGMAMHGIFRFDGSVLCDGSHNCSQDLDTIFIELIP